MSFDPVDSYSDPILGGQSPISPNHRRLNTADLFDPIESDTDSLFGETRPPPQAPRHWRRNLSPAEELPQVDLFAEPSLFIDDDEPWDLERSPSLGLEKVERHVEDPLRDEPSKHAHSPLRHDGNTQAALPAAVNDHVDKTIAPHTTSEDSDSASDSESTLEGSNADDIPAEVAEEHSVLGHESRADEGLVDLVSFRDLENALQSTLSVELPVSSLLAPKSHYEPFDAGAPELSERKAVTKLLEILESTNDVSDQDFLELHLEDFVVYSKAGLYGVEMHALSDWGVKPNSANFFLDGVLSAPGSDKRYFVGGVQVHAVPIGNYTDLDEHTVKDDIWIVSPLNSRRELYYKLCRPSKEYKRFHEPFLWVADLAKHFVDFIKNRWNNGVRVSVHHFTRDFKEWLTKHHAHNPTFCEWLTQYPRSDFRVAVVANLPFLHKEAVGVLGEQQTYVHIIWKEAWSFTQYPPYEKPSKEEIDSADKLTGNLADELEGDSSDEPKKVSKAAIDKNIPQTVVTPYIKACFKKLPFGDLLQATELSTKTTILRDKAIQRRHLEEPHAVNEGKIKLSTINTSRIEDIRPGDTLSTGRDVDGHWERQETSSSDVDRWFVLVQAVNVDKMGRREFDVIWYYQPVDTLCGVMEYPWANELFLSDHCNCEEPMKISEREILGIHDIDFHGTGTTGKELFCRQTYLSEDRKFVTLKDSHFRCPHHRPNFEWNKASYKWGETVLAHLDRKTQTSEPCEVISSYPQEARGSFTYKLRRFLRRDQIDPASGAPPNEVVYSEDMVTVSEKLIKERCSVRQFRLNEAIPCPYSRRGTGAFFFMTHEQVLSWNGKQRVVPLKAFKKTFKQGYDPKEEIPKLRGLDLFCGGGNLGRGLEDGGGIQMKWANDYVDKAIHTYMANADPGEVHPFQGSIDIMQQLAIEGRFSKSVPRPGEVDFISGGSPCPGFSRLTNDKTTRQQRKNQSLVAAFASMVDLYRPKYGLLENVPGIVQKKANKDQDVFCQLICALVGLGYQTSFYLMDANSCGAPQKRARVFVVFAAPGCELPLRPVESHSQPPWASASSLGRLPNGLPMTERVIPEATPFKHVTAAEATADLPRIFDGKPDICVSHPDHRVTIGQTFKVRKEQTHIPIQPYGMNFAKAWYSENFQNGAPGSGVLTKSERGFYPADKPGASMSRVARSSRAYGRVHPNGFLGTITTRLSANDAKDGTCLHWRENRVITLMEARRAQGFRDEDVLLGSVGDQFKIVGNSVAREISVALGAAFREAWVATLNKRRGKDAYVQRLSEPRRTSDRPTTDSFVDLTDDNMSPLPNSPAAFTPSLKTSAPASGKVHFFDDKATLNGNGKRRTSQHEDAPHSKAQRRSSTSLTLTQESSHSGTEQMTRTTMTFTTVNAVNRSDSDASPARNGDLIVIDD